MVGWLADTETLEWIKDRSLSSRGSSPPQYFSAPAEELKLHCVVFWGVGVDQLKQDSLSSIGSGLDCTLQPGRRVELVMIYGDRGFN